MKHRAHLVVLVIGVDASGRCTRGVAQGAYESAQTQQRAADHRGAVPIEVDAAIGPRLGNRTLRDRLRDATANLHLHAPQSAPLPGSPSEVSVSHARLSGACVTAGAAALTSAAALAQGFGQRFDLPIPLWLWLAGAALTVVLSSAVVIDFFRLVGKGLSRRGSICCASAPSDSSFAPCCCQRRAFHPDHSYQARRQSRADAQLHSDDGVDRVLVGMAFVSALVGDIWAAVNPLRTLFLWLECCLSGSWVDRCRVPERIRARWANGPPWS